MNKNEKFHGAPDAKDVSEDILNGVAGGIGNPRYGCPKCGMLLKESEFAAHKAVCPFNNLPKPTLPENPAGCTCPRCGRVFSSNSYALHVLECGGIG